MARFAKCFAGAKLRFSTPEPLTKDSKEPVLFCVFHGPKTSKTSEIIGDLKIFTEIACIFRLSSCMHFYEECFVNFFMMIDEGSTPPPPPLEVGSGSSSQAPARPATYDPGPPVSRSSYDSAQYRMTKYGFLKRLGRRVITPGSGGVGSPMSVEYVIN